MKFSTMILSSFVLAQASFAAPIFCKGGTYALVTDDSQRTATVTQNGEAVTFGDLDCAASEGVLSCSSRQVADAGYTATIQLAAPGTDMTGELNEETFAGARKLTDLQCVGAANGHRG